MPPRRMDSTFATRPVMRLHLNPEQIFDLANDFNSGCFYLEI